MCLSLEISKEFLISIRWFLISNLYFLFSTRVSVSLFTLPIIYISYHSFLLHTFSFLRQRHLRADRGRGVAPGALQQALDHHIQGDPDSGAPAATRGAGQARGV